MFELFCLINNFMIWKRKKKERKKKRNVWWWWQDSNPELMDYETRALPLSYRNQLHSTFVTKYVFIFNMASRTYDLRPVQSLNSNFDLKNLIKCIYKVVNVSKSQYYEFRHNIMNLGNQNSKYSWRIRDLENPQTGTQFANSVLMYKICLDTLKLTWLQLPVSWPLVCERLDIDLLVKACILLASENHHKIDATVLASD